MSPQEEKFDAMLIRVDERTRRMETDIKYLRQHHVTREEFEPLKKLVWCGLMTAIGSAVTIVTQVIMT